MIRLISAMLCLFLLLLGVGCQATPTWNVIEYRMACSDSHGDQAALGYVEYYDFAQCWQLDTCYGSQWNYQFVCKGTHRKLGFVAIGRHTSWPYFVTDSLYVNGVPWIAKTDTAREVPVGGWSLDAFPYAGIDTVWP